MISMQTCAAVYCWLGVGLFWFMAAHALAEEEPEATGWMKWLEDRLDEVTMGIVAMIILVVMFLCWPALIFMPRLWRRQPTSE